MRFRRSWVGVLAGLLLGLGVIILSAPSLNLISTQYTTPTLPAYLSVNTTLVSTTSNTSGNSQSVGPSGTISSTTTSGNSNTGQQGKSLSPSATFGVANYAQVSGFVRQPVMQTGFVLLPVLAAFLFGFMLYRASKIRNKEIEPPETG